MHISTTTFLLIVSVLFSLLGACTDGAFPAAIFPLLSSGWYYKPTPAESVVLGLIVVKVLALRLASITGLLPIPYHLNDLFLRSLGKRSVPEMELPRTNLTSPHDSYPPPSDEIFSKNSSHFSKDIKKRPTITQKEFQSISRVLLGLRRIDVGTCFLKSLCAMSHRVHQGKSLFTEDSHVITTLRYLIEMEKTVRTSLDSHIMDVYESALTTGQNADEEACKSAFRSCTLSDAELEYDSLLAETI